MTAAVPTTIIRIELWHGLLLAALVATLGPVKIIEPWSVLAGGVFMGVNFFLLSYGVRLVLTPLAGRGRVKLGVSLLILKFLALLGLITAVFFRFELDALSFAVGFSTLLIAIVLESLRKTKMERLNA